MAKHDIDPVLQQLAQAINESGQGAVPARGRLDLRAGTEDDRGPFARLLGNP